MRQTQAGNQILTFCPKIKKISSNPIVFYPPNRAFALNRADLSLDRSEIFLNTFHHQQICTSKQHIRLVEIFVNASVPDNFGVDEAGQCGEQAGIQQYPRLLSERRFFA